MTDHPDREMGLCPGCDSSGKVASPCPTAGCERYEHHFIPETYHHRLTRLAMHERDQNVGRLVDGFLLVARVGKGGSATVYMALQGDILIRRAFKLMNISSDSTLYATVASKFRNEAEVLATLEHPGIVGLIHHGFLEETPYIVLEYVDAPALSEVMISRGESGRPFTGHEILSILRQVLDALDTAHRRGLVHRDIKPGNMLLQTFEGQADHVRLVDFALAKYYLVAPETALVAGTPEYMAPELEAGGPVSPAADVFSTSVLLLHMLTGLPAMLETVPRIRRSSGAYDYRRVLQGMEVPLPQALDRFFARSLALSPHQRFPDARSMREALDRIADQIPDARWPRIDPSWSGRSRAPSAGPSVDTLTSSQPTALIPGAAPEDPTLSAITVPPRWLDPLAWLLVSVLLLGAVELVFPTIGQAPARRRARDARLGQMLPRASLLPETSEPFGPAHLVRPRGGDEGAGIEDWSSAVESQALEAAELPQPPPELPLAGGASGSDLLRRELAPSAFAATVALPLSGAAGRKKSSPGGLKKSEKKQAGKKDDGTERVSRDGAQEAPGDPAKPEALTFRAVSPKEAKKPSLSASVQVQSTPSGADLFLPDGRRLGQTPLELTVVQGQSKRVVAKKTGYLDRWVTVHGNQERVHLVLETGIW